MLRRGGPPTGQVSEPADEEPAEEVDDDQPESEESDHRAEHDPHAETAALSERVHDRQQDDRERRDDDLGHGELPFQALRPHPQRRDRDLAQTQQSRSRTDHGQEDDHDEDEPCGHEHVRVSDGLTHEVDEADRQCQSEVADNSEDDTCHGGNQRFGHSERSDL